MRSFEIEALEAGKARAPAREEADTASPDLAARAAAAGRTDALAPASVLRLQRAAGNAGVAAVLEGEQEQESPVKDVIGKGSGQPIDAPVRQRMESSFGTDFSDVRVHTDGSAAASAAAVDAHAYTVGNEIVLGEGNTPGTPAHERTLAHELTHVVQQREGPVDGTPTAGGVSISDPSDRFERAAEATADAVLATGRAPGADATGAAGPASVQREEMPEEEMQELAIQRQETPEEEELQALSIQREEDEEEELAQTLRIQRQETPEEDELQALSIQREETEEEELAQTLRIQRQEELPEEEI